VPSADLCAREFFVSEESIYRSSGYISELPPGFFNAEKQRGGWCVFHPDTSTSTVIPADVPVRGGVKNW
jgi:hypothetical protein